MSAIASSAWPVPAGSSGDLLADRRYAYAEALAADGDFAAAADLFAQAIEIVPGWAAAHLARGSILARVGDLEGARAGFEAAMARDPEDRLGAVLHLARLEGAVPAGMPSPYVTALFDQYAPRFDAHLVDGLGYRGPAVILAALQGLRTDPAAAVLDLGCGTGLMAAALEHPGLVCDGIDLSGAMLRKAERTGSYRRLWQGDCVTVARGLPEAGYRLVVAADVLVYMGEIAPLLVESARMLVPGGLFAATVQAGPDAGFDLGADLRYRHGATYLRGRLAAAGLTLLRLDPCVTRREAGADVPGLVFVARRP